jgi:endonuclease III
VTRAAARAARVFSAAVMPDTPAEFAALITTLARQHGQPEPPTVTDPFAMVIWENVAYLVNDARRVEVFARLESALGTTPEELLDVPASTLAELIEGGGMHPPRRAERVLLFNGAWAGLAPDSNVLRVLLRLGFGTEEKAYARTYGSVNEAVACVLPEDTDQLVRAHQLLRTHGQQLCKNSKPRCEACPVQARCRWWSDHASG